MSKARSIAKVSAKGVFNIFWGLASYLVTTPLVGAITKADIQNFKEMVK